MVNVLVDIICVMVIMIVMTVVTKTGISVKVCISLLRVLCYLIKRTFFTHCLNLVNLTRHMRRINDVCLQIQVKFNFISTSLLVYGILYQLEIFVMGSYMKVNTLYDTVSAS